MKIDPGKMVQARIDKGLNATTASVEAKISRTQLYRLEHGVSTRPQVETLSKLADLYDKNINYFLVREEQTNG